MNSDAEGAQGVLFNAWSRRALPPALLFDPEADWGYLFLIHIIQYKHNQHMFLKDWVTKQKGSNILQHAHGPHITQSI